MHNLTDPPTIEFRIRKMVEWLTEGEMDLVIIYRDQPDWEGHKYGVNLNAPNNLTMMLRNSDDNIGIWICTVLLFVILCPTPTKFHLLHNLEN